jgi:nucleoside-diphosphate-sugar epimerase
MIVVTGANGFVGRALCGHLRSLGRQVRAVSRSASPGCLAVGPIDARTDWSAALRDAVAVVHLAARVHVMHDTVEDPLAAFRAVNVEASVNLATQAARHGVRRFVFVSSIKVNGETSPRGRPFRPEDPPAPVDPYGISKREAEDALLGLGRDAGMEVVVIRPPLVYGPGVKANFRAMMRWLQRGVPLPLGAVHNRRSLVGLDNLVDLIVTCIDHPAAAHEVFMAGDGEDVSTPELLRRLAAALGVRARLVPVPPSWLVAAATVLGKRAVAQRLCGDLQVDVSRTTRILGWVPPNSVDEGLRRVASDFLQQRRT